MNAYDPFILYADASTKDIGGIDASPKEEKPCVFVSHRLSDQATTWGVMDLFAFVFCVKILILTNLVNYLR